MFLDNHAIERSTGFQRVLHHPAPRGVVIPADKPWERNGLSPQYVGKRADGKLECYYRTHAPNLPDDTTCYAVSENGLHWEKPALGLVDGPDGNNIVPCGVLFNLGRDGNVTDPDKQFLLCLGEDDTGVGHKMRLFFGPAPPDWSDPNWRAGFVEVGKKPSYKLGIHFYDDAREDWVFMRQSPNHPPGRCIARWWTKDLQQWHLKPVIYPDADDSTDPRYFDDMYGMRSVHMGGMVLGFFEWLVADQTRPDLSVFEKELIGRVYHKGTMECRIAVSRDGGYTWDRTVSREPWIPSGSEEDSYDRMVNLYAAPVRMGDEDWFYAAVRNGDHAAGVGYYRDGRTCLSQGGLYTQKHNRYVSLTVGNTPHILITKPIEVTGDSLQLNVDAGRGEVKVGIGIDRTMVIFNTRATLPNYMVRDRENRTHLEEGFRLADCEPVHVDSIAHTVRWKNTGLEALRGKTVRLYILAQDADLYGFRFR